MQRLYVMRKTGENHEAANRPRRGSMLALLVVLMVLFAAVASLAVDYGHVQLIKTELQRTADATARGYLYYSSTNGQSYANSHVTALYSSTNNPITDGGISPTVTVTPGFWTAATSTFSATSGSVSAVKVTVTLTSSGNNAVPLIWGPVFGAETIDLHATAIAYAATAGYQIVGLNGISFNSSCYADSYNSGVGSYTSQSPGSQGSIASNGVIDVYSGSTIHGNVYYSGVTPTINNVGGSCTGSQTSVPAITAGTPTTPGGATSKGNINITSSAGNTTLTAGTYSCTGITVDSGGTLTIDASSGPVNLYCSGQVSGNGGNITVTGNIPGNFHLYMVNSSAVQMNSGSYWYMVIDAPLSNVSLTASAALYGSVIANKLTVDAGTAIHFDQALGANGPGSGGNGVFLAQ